MQLDAVRLEKQKKTAIMIPSIIGLFEKSE